LTNTVLKDWASGNWYSLPAGTHKLVVNFTGGRFVGNEASGEVIQEFVSGRFYTLDVAVNSELSTFRVVKTDVTDYIILNKELHDRIVNSSSAVSERDFKYAIIDGGKAVRITGYRGGNREVIIPDKINGRNVTSIGERAFGSKQLTSVTIPESVTSIVEGAFYRNQLTSVTIPEGVTSIGNFAFSNNQLTSVIIPESVTSIGVRAFFDNQLTSVTIPESVTSIGDYAFDGNKLTNVIIPAGVTSIVEGAFYRNQLTNVTIPEGVTSIGRKAFSFNQLTSITIPASVTSISAYAFSDNPLTSVTILANVSTIEEGAFDSPIHGYRNGLSAGTYERRNNQWYYNGTALGAPER